MVSRMRTASPNAAATNDTLQQAMTRASSALILPAAIVMGAVVIYPILTTMWLSDGCTLISLSPPSFAGLSNYADWLAIRFAFTLDHACIRLESPSAHAQLG